MQEFSKKGSGQTEFQIAMIRNFEEEVVFAANRVPLCGSNQFGLIWPPQIATRNTKDWVFGRKGSQRLSDNRQRIEHVSFPLFFARLRGFDVFRPPPPLSLAFLARQSQHPVQQFEVPHGVKANQMFG